MYGNRPSIAVRRAARHRRSWSRISFQAAVRVLESIHLYDLPDRRGGHAVLHGRRRRARSPSSGRATARWRNGGAEKVATTGLWSLSWDQREPFTTRQEVR